MPGRHDVEETARVTKALTQYVRTIPSCAIIRPMSAPASPLQLPNGLVRHYYLRDQPHEADIQINLVAKQERTTQSHDIAVTDPPSRRRLGGNMGRM